MAGRVTHAEGVPETARKIGSREVLFRGHDEPTCRCGVSPDCVPALYLQETLLVK